MNRSAWIASIAFATTFLLLANVASAQSHRQDQFITNGWVDCMVELDGKLYIGGEFSEVGPPTGAAVPIDKATGLAQGLPKVMGQVFAVASDGAGGWYLGGLFTHVAGQPRQNLAHVLADQSVSPWNPGVSGAVRSLLVNGNNVYVGGSFSFLGGQYRPLLGSVDAVTGTTTSWDPNVDGASVYALALDGGTVYAGGDFTACRMVARNRLAALDTTTGTVTSWNPGADAAVTALILDGGTVYVGGAFTTAAGQPRNRIAAVDKVTGTATSWNPNANNTVTALATRGGIVYAGGYFTSIGGQSRVGIAALDATGSATSWNPNANAVVHALAVSGDTVYVGGEFSSLGGQARNRVAALNATTGSATSWNPRPSAAVRALGVNGGTVMVAGDFSSVGGQTRRNLAAIDLATGTLASWNPDANGFVKAMVTESGKLYVGGDFTQVGGQSRVGLAQLDATSGIATSWNPSASAAVYALAIDGGTLYAGGGFLAMGGQPRSGIAAVSAATGQLTAWNPGANGAVRIILPHGNVVYAAGEFTSIGGQPRRRLAALDASTGQATAWDPNPAYSPDPNYGFPMFALAADDSVIYVSGVFTTIGGQPRWRFAALDATSGLATTWYPNYVGDIVLAIMARDGIVVVGGSFSSFGGQPRNNLAALDATSGLAIPWNPNIPGSIRSLAAGAHGLSYSGGCTSSCGQPHTFVAGVMRSLFVTGGSVAEGGTADFDLRLIPAASSTTNVHYSTQGVTATADEDFTSASGQVTFQPGEGVHTISAATTADGIPEFDETFSLSLSNDSGVETLAPGLMTIRDDDSAAILCRNFPMVNGTVNALVEMGGILYIGGSFTQVIPVSGPPVERSNIAAIDLNTGMPTAWDPGSSGRVLALAAGGGAIYAGGYFTAVGGQTRNNIAALDPVTGAATAWNPNANGLVNAIAVGDGVVYVGGDFTTIGGQSHIWLAAVSPSSGIASAWNPFVDWNSGSVNALAMGAGKLYVGGWDFKLISGEVRRGLIEFDTASGLATSWNPQLRSLYINYPSGLEGPPNVLAIKVDGNVLYVGGYFLEASGLSRRKIAAFNLATGLITGWNPNGGMTVTFGDGVQTIVVSDGVIYVGGIYFSTMGGQAREGVAALDPTSGLATPWNPNPGPGDRGVLALAAAGGRIYAGGLFTSILGQPISGLACLVPVASVDVPEPAQASDPDMRISPNPTNGLMRLDFVLPRSGRVKIHVFDVQGRLLERPVDQEFQAGTHRSIWNAKGNGPGLFFVRFEALGRTLTRRVIAIH